jgi:hypothetical protein
MRRLLPLIACASLLAAAAADPATAATVADRAVPLSAKVTSCTTGPDQGDRAAAFTGSMPAWSTSRSLQMRFVLLQRRGTNPKGTFKALVVPDWGGWETSAPGKAGFVFTQRIESLLTPAAYKAAIYFRWLDRKGRVLRMLRRTTAACEQPDLRPDLVFAALDAAPVAAGGATYTVAVSNDGRSRAGASVVTLAFDGVLQGTAALPALDPGERASVTISAPRCAATTTVAVSVDAEDAVDEADETGNFVTRPCPIKPAA